MQKNLRRKMRILLGVLIAVMYAMLGAALAESDVVDSGYCGDNVTYTIQGSMSDGYTLIISGTGEMDSCPWRGQDAKPCAETYRFRTTIRKVIVGNGITELTDYCFEGLEGLSEVQIGEGVEEIPNFAFYGCCSLCQIDVKNATAIGDYAFSECVSLNSIQYPYVTYMGDRAFEGCSMLETFTLPAGMKEFSPTVVENCSITAFYTAANATSLMARDGVIYSADGKTLYAIPNMKSGAFSVPDTVQKIGYGAFYKNKYITSVTVPDSVNGISNMAFSGMKALQQAVLQCRCDIPNNCFAGCSELRTVVLGNEIPQIMKGAFSSCSKLVFPEIPDGTLVVTKDAFPYNIADKLPQRFQDNGTVYAVVNSVSIQLTESYDDVNALFQVLKAQAADKGGTIYLNTDLCDIAMERASLMTVFYEGVTKSNPTNPRFPDGSQMKNHYASFNAYECVYQSGTAEGAAAILRGFQQDTSQSKQIAKAKSVGIGCVRSGDARYWVIEVSSSAGDASAFGSGEEDVTKDISYAKYLVRDPQIYINGTIECREGSYCTPEVYFGSPSGSHGILAANQAILSPRDTSYIATDDEGRLRAIGIGRTQVDIRYQNLTCTADYDIIAAYLYEDLGTAVTAHGCSVGAVFQLQFYVPETIASAYEQTYLVIEKPVYRGNTFIRYEREILSKYQSVNNGGQMGRVYVYDNISAKEMSSEIRAIFYGIADSELYAYDPDEYSIREYAQTVFLNSTFLPIDGTNYNGSVTTLKRMLADMLTYGAEAQKYFEYHVSESADAGLETEIAQFGTTGNVTIPDINVFETIPQNALMYLEGFSISLENEIAVNIYINSVTEPIYEECLIQTGNDSFSIPAESWEKAGEGRYRIVIAKDDALSCTDRYCVVIRKDGNVISNRMNVGVEAYAYLVETRDEEALTNLTQALLRLSKSAEVYCAQ